MAARAPRTIFRSRGRPKLVPRSITGTQRFPLVVTRTFRNNDAYVLRTIFFRISSETENPLVLPRCACLFSPLSTFSSVQKARLSPHVFARFRWQTSCVRGNAFGYENVDCVSSFRVKGREKNRKMYTRLRRERLEISAH